MKYFYSTLERGGSTSKHPFFGTLAFLFQTIKENQNGLHGLHFAANVIHSDIMFYAFPHGWENKTQVFENFLITM